LIFVAFCWFEGGKLLVVEVVFGLFGYWFMGKFQEFVGVIAFGGVVRMLLVSLAT